MKKITAIIGIMVMLGIVKTKVQAQFNNTYNNGEQEYVTNFFYYSYYTPDNKCRIKIKNNNITESKHYKQIYKAGKPIKSAFLYRINKYDHNGNISNTKKFNKKGDAYSDLLYQYNDSNLVTSIINKNKKNKITSTQSITYDSLKNIVFFTYRKNHDGKYIQKYESKYDSTRILQTINYKKDGKSIHDKWVYDYYPNHQRKQTIKYNAHNKPKHIWNYACKTDGELLGVKHKDTTTICKNDEFDKDGNKIKTLRRTNQKGKMEKWIYKYNKKDEILSIERYNHKDILVLKGTKTISENTNWEYFNYNSKGKLRTKTISIFDINNNYLSYEAYKHNGHKLVQKYTYAYNNKNNITEMKRYNHKNQIKTIYTYDYL